MLSLREVLENVERDLARVRFEVLEDEGIESPQAAVLMGHYTDDIELYLPSGCYDPEVRLHFMSRAITRLLFCEPPTPRIRLIQRIDLEKRPPKQMDILADRFLPHTQAAVEQAKRIIDFYTSSDPLPETPEQIGRVSVSFGVSMAMIGMLITAKKRRWEPPFNPLKRQLERCLGDFVEKFYEYYSNQRGSRL